MFFLLQWKDDSESIRPSQWLFDGEKWEILDEVRWEGEDPWDAGNDMIGFQWPINGSIEGFDEKGCRKLCHAPEKEDKMFTHNPDEKTDVWLWKAGITNPLGYADSYYLDNTDISRKDEQDRFKRLTAAHKTDELGEGNLNYVRNYKGGKPIWMPKANSNDGQFLFMGDEVSLDQSRIKKGDSIPGWVLARPKGSRGTINAKGMYDADSKSWTLELSRKLISNDKEHDVQFTDLKKAYYFGLAVWDNEDLLAHTRVKKPIELSFE